MKNQEVCALSTSNRRQARIERRARKSEERAAKNLNHFGQCLQVPAGCGWKWSTRMRGMAIGLCEVGRCHFGTERTGRFFGHHVINRVTTRMSVGSSNNAPENCEYRCAYCEIYAHENYLSGNIPYSMRPLEVQVKYAELHNSSLWRCHPASLAYLSGQLSPVIYQRFPLPPGDLSIAV